MKVRWTFLSSKSVTMPLYLCNCFFPLCISACVLSIHTKLSIAIKLFMITLSSFKIYRLYGQIGTLTSMPSRVNKTYYLLPETFLPTNPGRGGAGYFIVGDNQEGIGITSPRHYGTLRLVLLELLFQEFALCCQSSMIISKQLQILCIMRLFNAVP